ncbi:uncharacterized protein N7496_001609 [Penicillium cataractarum]|uniref:Xylanolytic transcriptional activator regulatory domain-containing protein n=1 Tax=Penicillium cataractarum TaxID=2100454 RepID=A0A9W9VW96_9EURO|nr:uncharacterized protein N7496_001609 [Penicillium cataractarum]KAJ5390541.1 hypothetical protein N7496_001609 [Penicillium cataractarum]
MNTPELPELITAISGNAEQPAQTSVNNPGPKVGNFSFAPPYNPATWMESNPIPSADAILVEEPNIQIDQFGLGGFDLSGFDVLRHIDAGLREEISAMEFHSSQRTQLFQTTLSQPLSQGASPSQSVQHLWFTTIVENPLQTTTLMQNHGQPSELLSPESLITTINENHRQSIYDRLQILTYEPTIPSTDLLNVGLRLYFAKVHTIFPLVHAATFQPCRDNADLVIAMCAIGGLFTGSDQGLQQGIYLFERVQKATLHNWEQLLARGREELTIAIQGAAISQLFGLLSGSAHLLLTVDAFHGPPIAWSRYLRLYSRPVITHIDADIDGHELEKIWHDWARNEEIVRVAHGLFIMDAELGGTLHHEPIQSWKAYKVPSACSERAFLASNARDWKSIYCEDLKRQRANSFPSKVSKAPTPPLLPMSPYVPETSSLTTYAALESISSQVLLRRSYEETCQTKIGDIQESFADLHHHILRYCPPNSLFRSAQEPLQLRVLQSLIYMEALADFNMLERVVGRDGLNLTTDEIASVTGWANSVNGKRCILHAIIIKRHVEERNMTLEPALHTPRAVFWAGLALFCYIRFGTSTHDFQPLTSLDFPEFSSMGIDLQTLVSEIEFPNAHVLLPLKLIFFSMIDFLQHAGHWRITKRFAAILSALGSSAFGSTS